MEVEFPQSKDLLEQHRNSSKRCALLLPMTSSPRNKKRPKTNQNTTSILHSTSSVSNFVQNTNAFHHHHHHHHPVLSNTRRPPDHLITSVFSDPSSSNDNTFSTSLQTMPLSMSTGELQQGCWRINRFHQLESTGGDDYWIHPF